MPNVNAARASIVTYSIGNSLTLDCDITGSGIVKLAGDSARYIYPCYHIRTSRSLIYIRDNPTDYSNINAGQWNQGLPTRQRKFLTLQPYDDLASTMGDDINACASFWASYIQSDPPAPVLGIYAAWPSIQFSGDPDYYLSVWEQTVVDSLTTLTIARRAYFDALYTRMAAVYGGSQLKMIPIGEALFNIAVAAKAGNLSGVSSIIDVYRDDTHLGRVGRFAAAVTLVACFFRLKPAASSATVAYFESLGGGAVALTETLAGQIVDIVWNTVKADIRTGVQ